MREMNLATKIVTATKIVGSNDSSSDSIIKGLKDPDMWIGAIVGAVGIEAL